MIQFNNTAIIAGPLFVTVENLSTGKTIDLNISGSERFSFSSTANTAVSTGPTILVLPANLATAAGLPVLSLIHGRFVLTLDEQGNITSITSVSGTVEDVCQLLQ